MISNLNVAIHIRRTHKCRKKPSPCLCYGNYRPEGDVALSMKWYHEVNLKMKVFTAIITAIVCVFTNWYLTEVLVETAIQDSARNPEELARQLEEEATETEGKDLGHWLAEAEEKIALGRRLETYTGKQTVMLKIKLAVPGGIAGFIGFFIMYGLTWALSKPLTVVLDTPMGNFIRFYFTPLLFCVIIQYLVISLILFPMWA